MQIPLGIFASSPELQQSGSTGQCSLTALGPMLISLASANETNPLVCAIVSYSGIKQVVVEFDRAMNSLVISRPGKESIQLVLSAPWLLNYCSVCSAVMSNDLVVQG